jgi:hypothetical protein
MPDIDDLLSRLAEGRIFSTMDLSNGFLQIPLSEEVKEKTAFVTEETTAMFERMLFGLKGAHGTFQRIMNTVFKKLLKQGLIYAYIWTTLSSPPKIGKICSPWLNRCSICSARLS